MKKILVAFVITMFASAAYAAETSAPASAGNGDSSVVHKSKKSKKKGKKSKKSKGEAAAPAPAEGGAAPAAPAGQ